MLLQPTIALQPDSEFSVTFVQTFVASVVKSSITRNTKKMTHKAHEV